MDTILSWGNIPKLVFKDAEEYFRTLGQLSNNKAFTISFEPNKNTGSYADAYRIRVLMGAQNITQALQNKITSNMRINCNEYVLNLVENHNFVQSGNTIVCTFENVLKTVPDQYKLIFMQGYNEVVSTMPQQVYYAADSIDISKVTLKKKDIPKLSSGKGSSLKKHRIGKRDYIKQAIDNYEIGEAGERIVYEYEQKKLKDAYKAGKITDLKDTLEWVSRVDDSVGYDIRSYDVEAKKEVYIEVKTTIGNSKTPIYMTENELEQSERLAEQYLLYRLYRMDRHKPENVDFFVLQGNIRKNPYVSVEKKNEYKIQIVKDQSMELA